MTLDVYAGLFGDDLDDLDGVPARLDLLVTEAGSTYAEHEATTDGSTSCAACASSVR